MIIASIGTLIVAIIALVVSIRAMKDNQKHMQLSMRPVLIGHYFLQSSDTFVMQVENRGIGPAVIKNWKFWSIYNKGKVVKTGRSEDLKSFIASNLPDKKLNFVYSSKMRDSILQPGESWKIFELSADEISPNVSEENIRRIVKKFCLEVEYESFYEERFTETVYYFKQKDMK